MGNYKNLLDACAHVVGGTQPTSVQTSIPAFGTAPNDGATDLRQFWYSGADAGDESGVPGIVGAWSRPTEKIVSTPVAMILPDYWEPQGITSHPVQGKKYPRDIIYVRIFVGNNDLATLQDQMADFRDTVETQFDTHMQLFNSTGVATCDCSRGSFLEVDWGGAAFLAIEFRLQIDRSFGVNRVG